MSASARTDSTPRGPLRRRFRTAALHALLAFVLPAGAAAAPAVLATGLVRGDLAAAAVKRLGDDYYDRFFALFPLDATEMSGDPKYEAALEIDIAPAHRERQRALFRSVLKELARIDPLKLPRTERLTYEVLKFEATDRLALLEHPLHLLPLNQLGALPVRLSQWGTGGGSQPMKTVAHYDHYLARVRKMPAWIDQAIANMNEGIARGIVQPRPLMERLLAQVDALLAPGAERQGFLGAIGNFPASFGERDRTRLQAAYEKAYAAEVAPALWRLRHFLAQRYLPASRDTAGIGALPGGAAAYAALTRSHTTTDLDAEAIHQLGLAEVARIRREMDAVRERVGFKGSLNEFLLSVDGRTELMPFSTEEEVLQRFRDLHARVGAELPKLFERAPKAALEVRPVDAVQRDTASDYYVPPAMDGSRPGVYFAVVQDAKRYNTLMMTALFLHEGQPGHHYQMALQQEMALPRFRQVGWYNAFGEGWGLYAESLGRELGVYDDPFDYLGRLSMELFRAIRLVTDTGLHAKGWTREQTIRYMLETQPGSESNARRATERYMAWPGQALAYKVGELQILKLRERARRALGERFDIRRFHTQVLQNGPLPLSLLERNIDQWIREQGATSAAPAPQQAPLPRG